MNGYSGEEIHFTDQALRSEFNENRPSLPIFKEKIVHFLREFKYQGSFKYSQQLLDNGAKERYVLLVDLDDINNFDLRLYELIRHHPSDLIVLFEQGCREVYAEKQGTSLENVPEFQVQIISNENHKNLRDLKSEVLNKIVTIRGIIVSATKVFIKSRVLVLKCSNCGSEQTVYMPPGLTTVPIPRACQGARNMENVPAEKCPLDTYYIYPEKCKLVDQQLLKIQENPENVPTGEIPRTFQVCVDRYLCNQMVPGSRVSVTGIYQIQETKNAFIKQGLSPLLKMPYIYALGFITDSLLSQRSNSSNFSNQDEQMFKLMAKDPKIYEKIASSIAPSIFGHDDIKQAIACMLFGGARQITKDKIKLRGDINVLLVGDPSTGKSQFLQFIEKVAPISVYTSGKGSSAAGLTASINKDPTTGEFQIEGGAMVLADGGVVSIDEFDKMRSQDRVALHEAMEQQTISIAKAGITTKLNSRCSVLAAANPLHGSYASHLELEDQIELQTTILSRFDAIFVVRDPKSKEHDEQMARHIIDIHVEGAKQNNQMEMSSINNNRVMEVQKEGEIPIRDLKRYIEYARTTIDPRLSEAGRQQIISIYVENRTQSSENGKKQKGHIPISVRQLEAIIRLSESISKMKLRENVNDEDVQEALRLFENSTMNAISNGGEIGLDSGYESGKLVQNIEDSIQRRVHINSSVSTFKLQQEMFGSFNNSFAVEQAVRNLIKMGFLAEGQGGKMLQRKQ